MLAIVVALAQLSGQAFVSLLRRPIRALVLAHVAHMLEVSVTDPANPDYPGIPVFADQLSRTFEPPAALAAC